MIVSPLFWEWFNLWLTQFLKDLYHEIKMVALRGGNSSIPYQQTCANHGTQSQPSGIDIRASQSAPSMNVQANGGQIPNQINMQSLSTISLNFVPPHSNTATHNHNHKHSHKHKHEQSSTRFSSSNRMPSSHSHHHYRQLPQSSKSGRLNLLSCYL